jgi:hypothetical protein
MKIYPKRTFVKSIPDLSFKDSVGTLSFLVMKKIDMSTAFFDVHFVMTVHFSFAQEPILQTPQELVISGRKHFHRLNLAFIHS